MSLTRGASGALAVLLICLGAARAEDLSGLVQRGWQVQSRGNVTRLQWHGPGSNDVINALLGRPEKTASSPKAWLEYQRARVETNTGKLENCHATDAEDGKTTGMVCEVNSGLLVIALIAAPVQPGTLRLVTLISSPTPASRQRLLADLPQFQLLLTQGSLRGPATESAATRDPAAIAPASGSTNSATARLGNTSSAHRYDAYLAPGKGFPPQQIEGVYHHWQWMAMLNMGMIDTGADYILFKNGEVWRHPQLPPQDIDIVKAKQSAAADWGSWRRAGSVVFLRMMGGQEERYDSGQWVRYEAAPHDQRVEGSWHTTLSYVSNVGQHSTSGLATNAVTLHGDGRFERDGFAGASFRNSTGSARSGGTFTNVTPTRTGRYRIDGYTLELDYDDGRVERDLFYWAGGPDKHYDMLVLNGSKYLGALKRSGTGAQ